MQQPKTKPPALIGSSRLNLALIGFLGCVVVYALRSDVSFAIVCMVNSTAVDALSGPGNESAVVKTSSCGIRTINDTHPADAVTGELIWPKKIQGYVLSAFFWGYMFSQIIGGYLAGRFGGKIVIGGTVLGGSILTLISPVAANTSAYAFVAIRALLGFFQGATFPAFHTMWSMWAPPLERSLLTGMTYAGAQVGNTLVMPLSGLLCKYGFSGGWPSIYYVLGLAGLLWCIVWFLLTADVPSAHRRISREEQSYIEDSLKEVMIKDDKSKKRAVPWVKIFTSLPVWALFIGHFAGDWGAYMMATSLPLFMNDVLGFDLTSLGFISAIPYITYFLFINIGGIAADKLRNAGVLSTISTRRLAMIIALGSQAVFLIASGYCGCGQEALVIVFLTLGIGLSGVQYAGFVVNYLDIAPTFAGPILGVGNTLSCVAGILCPLLVGLLTPHGTKEEWQIVFWITGAILAIGTIIFCLFAKGDVLPWARGDAATEEEKEELKGKEDSDGY